MLPTKVLYDGTDEPLPKQTPLWAGPLSLIYENGDLRYIRLGDREIARRIYVAVRDRNWGTLLPVLSNVQIADHGGSFQITYDVTHRQNEIDFGWRGNISGAADGTIRFEMDGTARTTFLRNRIGFCVLHPMRECVGASARVEHVDGSTEDAHFPLHIAPQSIIDGIIQPVQPFSEMRAVMHEVAPGVQAEIRFEGETFEMEDQRNWTDGSFKTYGTPLRLPFPAEITAGTPIRQAVTLTLYGAMPTLNEHKPAEDAVSFVLNPLAEAVPLPRIGLGVASHDQSLTEREIERLKALHLAHLRVDLQLRDPTYPAALQRASVEAAALAVPLEIALLLSDDADAELRDLGERLHALRPTVAAWLIFHERAPVTTEQLVRLARQHLAAYDSQARIGGGTNAYFTDINRSRPPVTALDLLCYSINPQVHAFDNASLAETPPAIAATVQSARQFAGGLPLAVTPVTLKPRFNPVAVGPEAEPAPNELLPQVDTRQMALFGAAWTLGSLKYLAESGAASVTYYETTGWRGVMEREAGSPLPQLFHSIPGAVFPLYHVLADAGAFAGGQVIPSASSEPLRVDGMVLHKAGRTSVLLANMRAVPQRVRVQGLAAQVHFWELDETNAEEAMHAPEAFRARAGQPLPTEGGALELTLRPYAVARIDYTA